MEGGFIMNKFNIGDEVVSIWELDKVGTIKSIDDMCHPEPKYTIVYEDGNEYANYEACFKLVVGVDDVLEKGEILVEDYFTSPCTWDNLYPDCTEIKVIRYQSHIYYVKEVDTMVTEFKELI